MKHEAREPADQGGEDGAQSSNSCRPGKDLSAWNGAERLPRYRRLCQGGSANWRDFLATAAVVRPMLGISPSAWEEAQMVMGEMQAAVVVACLLQRSSAIQSAGGYLRELTRKAREGEFSMGPILMAQINARSRERRSA
jgi:Replication protein C C-terminal region